jgi:hypothetical protein
MRGTPTTPTHRADIRCFLRESPASQIKIIGEGGKQFATKLLRSAGMTGRVKAEKVQFPRGKERWRGAGRACGGDGGGGPVPLTGSLPSRFVVRAGRVVPTRDHLGAKFGETADGDMVAHGGNSAATQLFQATRRFRIPPGDGGGMCLLVEAAPLTQQRGDVAA